MSSLLRIILKYKWLLQHLSGLFPCIIQGQYRIKVSMEPHIAHIRLRILVIIIINFTADTANK